MYLLLQNITQSLAGRVAMLRLFPFSIEHVKKQNLPIGKSFVCYGGSGYQERSDGTKVISWTETHKI